MFITIVKAVTASALIVCLVILFSSIYAMVDDQRARNVYVMVISILSLVASISIYYIYSKLTKHAKDGSRKDKANHIISSAFLLNTRLLTPFIAKHSITDDRLNTIFHLSLYLPALLGLTLSLFMPNTGVTGEETFQNLLYSLGNLVCGETKLESLNMQYVASSYYGLLSIFLPIQIFTSAVTLINMKSHSSPLLIGNTQFGSSGFMEHKRTLTGGFFAVLGFGYLNYKCHSLQLAGLINLNDYFGISGERWSLGLIGPIGQIIFVYFFSHWLSLRERIAQEHNIS